VTRAQLGAVAVLSLFSTAIVLADGAGTTSSAAVREALARLAAAKPATPAATERASAPAAPVPATAGGGGSSAGGVAATVAPAASTPAASVAGGATTTKKAHHSAPAAAAPRPSKVRHVFVIALTGTGSDVTFGPTSTAPYLAKQLRPKGTLLDNYVPLDGADLTNELALIGGQPPNADTSAECTSFKDFPPNAVVRKSGVVSGDGCVYPNTVLSLGDQLTASRRSWRAYVEDMGNGPAGAQTCRHPDDGAADDTLHGRAGDQYATRHNPFVYFHSLLDLGDCQADDVTLDKLTTDLGAIRTTPSLAFIAPNLCDAGTEIPCVDGRPGGLLAVDAFLQQWVPRILRSPAYRKDGLLMITFLSSATTTPTPTPAPAPATPAAPPRTGVLLLSRYAKPAATIDTPYDAYGLLRSIEDVFALTPLAKAAAASSFAKPALAGAFPGQ
jgi:hypothetical protein